MAAKVIGYARVSTSGQDSDRQVADLRAAGVRADDMYVDSGVSGAKAKRPELDRAMSALEAGDTLVITTLDRLGRSTVNMLELSRQLDERGVNLRVLNLGGEAVDTRTPMGRMVFTVMAALAEMEWEVKSERNRDSVTKRRAKGADLGGRREQWTDQEVRRARGRIADGESATAVARAFGMSRATLYRRIGALAD
ncbi:resolvase [Tersicoccus phoenicis]|uniref:Resolvase n=1 Tax=Tersicoccus phoenicis TaxID=554083 RepID=A0A1R1LHQ5_9MICC|nr:recombinase family protein [Tersicoccus phoenicis]OMH27075.1 resolvase [Tersicoccus phoenicis]